MAKTSFRRALTYDEADHLLSANFHIFMVDEETQKLDEIYDLDELVMQHPHETFYTSRLTRDELAKCNAEGIKVVEFIK